MKRRAFLSLAGAAGLTVALQAGNAAAASPEAARSLVQNVSSQVIELIKQPGAAASKAPQLKAIMEQNLDMRQVAGFALGRYARGASPAQRDRYVAVYSDYVARVYSNRFSEYGGETITVKGAQDVGRKGIFVNSTVNFNGQTVNIGWQVRENRAGALKIVDINVDGLSMAESQRSEFTRMISEMGGDIDAFTTRLQTLGV